ncbi:hypothetical protein NCLIV_021550 [Neospora caninum Liverpool]|uniref:CRAL/TRIO domain-containing protein n=1 Tax=Neospora caninum (strain Liverpool) TaxID=572307 RepID=F0VF73_NEOCL|nr:hypothetical protein NCLIV_021550 [Neospora caninum Liverpool]CBZ52367.1 hypothetical protein NCLIV_021550 [Neospora caninum Liverpool]CEL66338.1 TPA: CRAL/TRIO domain-containing protein [Neospora caninum Liverpool]|eukprot:XP_003882399.1 hypothetical protein NCLIV_021550 [Neospora caninum Liverpool]
MTAPASLASAAPSEKVDAASVSLLPRASGEGESRPTEERKEPTASGETVNGELKPSEQAGEVASPRHGPPPRLSCAAPRLSALPSHLFSSEQRAKVEALRRLIDSLSIEAASAASLTSQDGVGESPAPGEETPARASSSSWFSWSSPLSFGSADKSEAAGAKEKVPEVTGLQWDELLWLDDLLLSRYLRSYGWEVEEAHKQLLRTLAWRRERKPHCIAPDDVIEIARKGSIYRRGFDSTGRAMIYFKPGRDPGTSSASSQQHILYTVERALQSVDRMQGHDQLVFLIDFNGWGISQIPNTDVSTEIVSILNDHYTDVLAEAYIVDAPSYFDAIWRLVSLMVHPDTAKKVLFLSTKNPEHVATLRNKIPPIFLETCVGGDCELDYEHNAYWEEERRQFDVVTRARQKALERLQADETLQKRVKKSESELPENAKREA